MDTSSNELRHKTETSTPSEAPMNDSQSIETDAATANKEIPGYLNRWERKQIEPWDTRSNLRALIGSTLIHSAILLLVALLWQPISKGTGSRDRAVGIALAHHKSDGVDYELQGGGANTASTAKSLQESTAAKSASANTAAIDQSMRDMLGPLAEAMNGINTGGEAVGGIGTPGITGEGSGGNARGNAAKTKTDFMGIDGEGNSFVYVVDYSESMAAYSGTPMSRAKQEMIRSIQSLSRVNTFQVVFYNDQPTKYSGLLNRTSGLIFANDIEKEAVLNYIRRIEPIGGTEHYRALLTALSMRPDVIFFLTDAAEPNLSPRQLDQVVSRAEGGLTIIHSIQFGTGENTGDGRWIEQLAKRTQGKFRYIDVTRLAENR